jgi:ribulose kinase
MDSRRKFLALFGGTAAAASALADVPTIERVQKIPGVAGPFNTSADPTFVMEFGQPLCCAALAAVHASWRAAWPVGTAPRLIVLDGGAKLKVLSDQVAS